MASEPGVSVVIATRRREARLARALEALARQSLERERYEVIVVRAADSLDGELAGAPEGLEVSFLVSPAAGAAAQRNVGLGAARGRLVAFTDDDCRAAPGWLEALLGAAGEHGPKAFVQGRVEPDPDERELLRGFARSLSVSGPNPWAPTCNIAYPRDVLIRIGGFDERFPGASGEDTDLALRAGAAGARPVYAAEALVWHAVHRRSLTGALADAGRQGNIALLLALHPEQRRALHYGLFLRKSHAYASLAALGLALAPRSRVLALLALAPYLRHFGWPEEMGAAPALRWLFVSGPRHGLLDLAEVLSLARASARHRALVL